MTWGNINIWNVLKLSINAPHCVFWHQWPQWKKWYPSGSSMEVCSWNLMCSLTWCSLPLKARTYSNSLHLNKPLCMHSGRTSKQIFNHASSLRAMTPVELLCWCYSVSMNKWPTRFLFTQILLQVESNQAGAPSVPWPHSSTSGRGLACITCFTVMLACTNPLPSSRPLLLLT